MPSVAPSRPPLLRPRHGRIVGGVCQGISDHLNVPLTAVRIAFLVLTVFGLAGPVLYAALWALIPQEGDEPPTPARGPRLRPATRVLREVDRDVATPLVMGVALLTAAALLVTTRLGLGIASSVLLPVAVVLAGAGLGLRALDRADPTGGPLTMSSAGAVLRMGGGLVLVVIGVVLALAPSLNPSAVLLVTLSAAAVLAGAGLVLGPWGLRLWRGLEAERRLRIRESERAEIAAHLHDSVLQTLALIQRRSHDADQVARLARSQERQLREWLYGAGSTPGAPASTLANQVRELCAQVEDDEGVRVEVVVVGPDEPLDDRTTTLTQALREALLNAVRHGRVGVSVYLEISQAEIECFIRDRGPGFDLSDIPADRAGVRESIIGRMERAGGTGRVRRAPGGGTEVTLSLTRSTAGGPR